QKEKEKNNKNFVHGRNGLIPNLLQEGFRHFLGGNAGNIQIDEMRMAWGQKRILIHYFSENDRIGELEFRVAVDALGTAQDFFARAAQAHRVKVATFRGRPVGDVIEELDAVGIVLVQHAGEDQPVFRRGLGDEIEKVQ